MMRLIERLDSVDDNFAPFGNHVIAEEKEKISFFNVMEYTPVLGSVIGSVEVLYGVIKIAVEIIRGIGNLFLKNSEYNFKKEIGSGVGTLGRGLALVVLPIFSGLFLYMMDQDRVWKYNHNNAVALLRAGDLTERDLDIAQEYAKNSLIWTMKHLKCLKRLVIMAILARDIIGLLRERVSCEASPINTQNWASPIRLKPFWM